MSETIDIYNQEQIVAALAAITAVVQANTITIEALKTHLGLSGINTGDQDLTGLVHSNRVALDAVAGTNTGDNAVNSLYSGLVSNATHTGDVTGATALTIANNAVTPAKMADVATGTVFYRKTASSGDPEVQTLATLKTDLGLSGTNTGDNAVNSLYSGLVSNATHTGDVTGATALTIAAKAVSLAKMADLASGQIIVGNVSNRPTAVTMSGGATMSNTGVVTLDSTPEFYAVTANVDFKKGSTPGYIYVPFPQPLTKAGWQGNSFSDVSTPTAIDLSSGWTYADGTAASMPAGVKAIALTVYAKDSGALGTQDLYFALYKRYDDILHQLAVRPIGGGVKCENSGIVNVIDGSTIYYKINASGTSAMQVWIYIHGAFI